MDAPGSTASVPQLVGTLARLISEIIDTARTARQNKRECEYLTVRLSIIGDVLPRLPQDAKMKRSLTELAKTLGEAHKLVLDCQNWSPARELIGLGQRHADSFKEVNARIDSHINLLNLIFNATAGRSTFNHTTTVPSPGSSSGPAAVRLTWAEIAAATDYFADELSRRSPEALYKGRLHDGLEVAVKVLNKNGRQDVEGAFVAEVEILFPLRHQHIVRLVGWCSEEEDRIIVYHHEHMSNGTLRDHLMRLGLRVRAPVFLRGGSSSSPVRATWKTRVEVLLGVSRAIEHLHRCGVIHRNVTSFNILLDGSWEPRLSGFGQAILQAAMGDQVVDEVVGTPGYLDPEYRRTGRVSPASDVYSFGMVILESLTGKDPATMQMDSVLLAIRNRKLPDVLVRRPAATPRQLEALELVAHTAECCLFPHGNDRPAMSDVVTSLHRALFNIDNKWTRTTTVTAAPPPSSSYDSHIGHDDKSTTTVTAGPPPSYSYDSRIGHDEESTITVTSGPPPSSSFGSLQSHPYEDEESSQPPESISTLLSSRGMTDQVTQLKALKGILIDATAEPIMLSYPFLSSITGNFSREIGRGGFGIVYQGDLGTRKVAVKKLSIIPERFSDTLFVEEIKCLIKAKHNNVVRFLGYCADTQGELILFNGMHVLSELPQRLLCFEYVPNGNLGKYLEDKSHKDEWKIRHQMIRGICHGLNCLHEQRITHLDLKPENILLDACMEPKIADFGISRCFDEGISRVYTKILRGTMGYIAPETIKNGEITFKSDIYGLGIIIIKLLTMGNYSDFESWHTSLDMDHPQVRSWDEIAQTCVHTDQHKRPTICKIMQKMNEIDSM